MYVTAMPKDDFKKMAHEISKPGPFTWSFELNPKIQFLKQRKKFELQIDFKVVGRGPPLVVHGSNGWGKEEIVVNHFAGMLVEGMTNGCKPFIGRIST